MKKALSVCLICLVLGLASFIPSPDTLVGRWQVKTRSGNLLLAIFRPKGTYDVFINGKAFINGKYYVRQDTFGFEEACCGSNYYGTYQISFFAQDSVRFVLIKDTCGGRREATNRLTLGRVKTIKP